MKTYVLIRNKSNAKLYSNNFTSIYINDFCRDINGLLLLEINGGKAAFNISIITFKVTGRKKCLRR